MSAMGMKAAQDGGWRGLMFIALTECASPQ
jgi:hypothetical protein